MSFESFVLNNLKKYKVLAIVGVFLSFFVVVGIINYLQRVTLEGFVSLKAANQIVENFTAHNNKNHTNETFTNNNNFMKSQIENMKSKNNNN
jgi:hypothetical protein